MRRIDSKWKDLHQGYQIIRKYQQEINIKWGRALKVTSNRIYQREYQNWMETLTFERKRFRTIILVALLLALITILCAGISLIFSFAFGLSFLAWGTVLFILTILVGALLIQRLVIYNLERRPPTKSDYSNGISDLEAAWWDQLKPPPIQIVEYGDEGEKRLLNRLHDNLPLNWIALHQYMTQRKLDADILVLGVNGIWILESKYNSGTIICRNGEWMHEKRYYEEGGKEVVQRKPKRPYDKQWLAERKSITETIMRRVPEDMKWVAKTVRGGIVFTHDNIMLDIDNSCQVEYGTIPYWMKKIFSSPKIPNLTMKVLLHIVEAISEYASQLSGNLERKSAKDLAIAIYKKSEKEIPDFIRSNI